MTRALSFAHAVTQRWFMDSFDGPTRAQTLGWPSIASGHNTLLLAPTGSGKTLAAFLVAIDRLLLGPPKATQPGVRVLYISPLKALAVDVERNLRMPLAEIRSEANRQGHPCSPVNVGVRSGDTSPKERARMKRTPPEILITTPESLYLLLTSQAAEGLRSVETVIIDEIHSLVPTKRGAHLALSLERLERIRTHQPPLQRIGLSATQRPLKEVARFLGGFDQGQPRPVTIVDAGGNKTYDVTIEVPVDDMARLKTIEAREKEPDQDSTAKKSSPSIWPAIHPELVKLIRAHQSTMVFVNSRRLAERIAEAINEVAGEELALAHHGSVAKDLRAVIEERLKEGNLPAIVATGSLELGIDIGAIDLVIQIEAPMSVASGIQRIGRAGHQVGAISKGIVFPKYRGDLLACAAVSDHIQRGLVEQTHYPRNALDVLAQQIVAVVAAAVSMHTSPLYDLVKSAAPYADLPRLLFDSVLNMLSGHYPSEQFGQLRARLDWDRNTELLTARRGSKMLAVANAGTIPDRGLFGVFLAGSDKPRRVGELDEEMVFECSVGDIFVLGASSWRIEEITHQQVLVTPAPGQAGKMPFWRGEGPGRPAELGRAIGALCRTLVQLKPAEAAVKLREHHGLQPRAVTGLMTYLSDQQAATAVVPSDECIVIERFRDGVGDRCIAILSPFGARVHAPWATLVRARLLADYGVDADVITSDDGILFRTPQSDTRPPDDAFFPDPHEVTDLLMTHLGGTALFAARFRENAARALLLPRRRAGERTPLWAQRRRSADLLQVAAGFPDFPIILETYRECLQDVFDLPELIAVLSGVQEQHIRVSSVHTGRPSPFAGALMFGYVGAFMYEGDKPLAERRAFALSLDHVQLRALLGQPEMRALVDEAAVHDVENALGGYPITHAGALLDRLRSAGDLSLSELLGDDADLRLWLRTLEEAQRIVPIQLEGTVRYIVVEDIARYRDGLGMDVPNWAHASLLQPVPDALRQILARFARTRGPFQIEAITVRYGLSEEHAKSELEALVHEGRLVSGALLPQSLVAERSFDPDAGEYCCLAAWTRIKRRTLTRLRAQIKPVPQAAYARFLTEHQRILPKAAPGIDSLAECLEQLEGAPLIASDVETLVIPARLPDFSPHELDELLLSGEFVWRGLSSLGQTDGRLAFYRRSHLGLIAPLVRPPDSEFSELVVGMLSGKGAMFFEELRGSLGRLGTEVLNEIWRLVWSGHLTNDSFAPVRSRFNAKYGRKRAAPTSRRVSRRQGRGAPAGSEGRWSLLRPPPASVERRLNAIVDAQLRRDGVVGQESLARIAKNHPGVNGFAHLYPLLKTKEQMGQVRRGYFIDGLGATQFALPGAEARLRQHRKATNTCIRIAADDPANPYGGIMPWPSREGRRPSRRAGAEVILVDGLLVVWMHLVGKTPNILTFFDVDDEQTGAHVRDALLIGVTGATGATGTIVLARIDEQPAADTGFGRYLLDHDFRHSTGGELYGKRHPPKG